MSVTTNSSSKALNPLKAGQLPRWAPWAGLGLALIVGLVFGGMKVAASTLIAAAVFVVGMHVLSLYVEGRRRANDRLAQHIVYGMFMLALVPLVWVSWIAVKNGLARLDAPFFTYSMRNIVGEGGGAAHAIYGTLYVTGIATAISVPIGLLTAIYLAEYGGNSKLAKGITFFVDVMTGIPSIVAGLFAYALMALLFGPGTVNGIGGAIALSVLMIPVVVRSVEELLRIVPNELREAAYALGVPKWKTILSIVIPTAISGIVSGVILAIARVIGETAPLMVAAGFTQSLNNNPTQGQMMTLPVFVYDSYAHPGIPRQPYWDRAWAGALTLILIVMLLNLIGRVIAARFAPKAGR
ncbi:phosphate ABC transporter permease PstA [Aestuariimicrobium ganziense]|uniref:phosphate ABC transporter permease PstA n=1 Tax=Aestuariimicrobium ganziense TaxID=2773677 RepID=UPI0019424330|nr:phosphate ABC transporter permease PstA [Aestuariimicrobium ganziense]